MTARRVRVLVVDDAAPVRALLADVLGREPELAVVGTPANGRSALQGLPETRPDVIVLDIAMPEMDGLEVLAELRRMRSRVPVILYSSLTRHGAAVTFDGLALGASDFVTKPSGRSLAAAREHVRSELVPRLLALGGAEAASLAGERPRPMGSVTRRAARVDVVAIGASTGGPNALEEILRALPADFRVPILVVQHMPPTFTAHFAERLDGRCALRVREAREGTPVFPGEVWIAPGGRHMTVERVPGLVLRLHDGPPRHSCRPSVDELFLSLAAAGGAATLALLLTGMGGDGAEGCRRIHEAGGRILAQDQASSVVWGMPGRVASEGIADLVLPLAEIAGEIQRRVSGPVLGRAA